MIDIISFKLIPFFGPNQDHFSHRLVFENMNVDFNVSVFHLSYLGVVFFF